MKEDILVLGEGPTKKSDGTTITAEAKYFINFNFINFNFTKSKRRICLSRHYNGGNSLLFNSTKIHDFKAKYLK